MCLYPVDGEANRFGAKRWTVQQTTGGNEFPAVKSAARTLEILERLAAAQERPTLGQLARDLGIPKSSLRAILQTLEGRGWVETDATGGRFGLGVRALLVGAAYVDGDDVVAVAAGTLDHLAATFGETVHLARLDGTDIVYLAKRETRHSLRLFSAIGRRLPAFTTALGKAVLAERTSEEVRAALPHPLPRLTPNTIGDPDRLDRELALTRARGYAVDNEENTEGIRCLAVALPRADPPVDAISLSVPMVRMSEKRERQMAAELLRARDALRSRPAGRD
jgi:DNA-binding IclR family transcriptional regulator